MSTRDGLVCIVAIGISVGAWAGELHGIGRAATEKEIHAWDIDVRADGRGLPSGRGSVMQGKRVYAEKCAACHGDRGQGGPMDRLAGGNDSLGTSSPVRTIGSYWPYAPTLFDYVRRAMPFNAPQSLDDSEVYAITAFLLHLNGIVAADTTLDASTLPLVRMPNRGGFADDPRPDASKLPCQSDCR